MRTGTGVWVGEDLGVLVMTAALISVSGLSWSGAQHPPPMPPSKSQPNPSPSPPLALRRWGYLLRRGKGLQGW